MIHNRHRFQPQRLQRSHRQRFSERRDRRRHIGFNYQIDKPLGGFVLGVEGSIDGTSLHKSVAAGFAAFGGSSVSASTNTDIQGSIRGRFGIAWDRLLAYATGGVAFGGFNTNYSFIGNTSAALPGGPVFGTNSFSNTRVGWTAGGGIDYSVTNNWSVFAEYRYTSFWHCWEYLACHCSVYNGARPSRRVLVLESHVEPKPGAGWLQLQIRHGAASPGLLNVLNQAFLAWHSSIRSKTRHLRQVLA
jgi:hypothetical protein